MGEAKRRRQLDCTWGQPLLYGAFFFAPSGETLFSVSLQVPRRGSEIEQDTAAVNVGKLFHWATVWRSASDARNRAIDRLGFDAETWDAFVAQCDELLPVEAWCMELWPPEGPAVYAGYGGEDLEAAKAIRGHEGALHQASEYTAGNGVGIV
jgi:hypothetical protein